MNLYLIFYLRTKLLKLTSSLCQYLNKNKLLRIYLGSFNWCLLTLIQESFSCSPSASAVLFQLPYCSRFIMCKLPSWWFSSPPTSPFLDILGSSYTGFFCIFLRSSFSFTNSFILHCQTITILYTSQVHGIFERLFQLLPKQRYLLSSAKSAQNCQSFWDRVTTLSRDGGKAVTRLRL